MTPNIFGSILAAGVAALLLTANAQSANSNSQGVQDSKALRILAQCYEAMGSPDESVTLRLQGSIVDTDHNDAIPRPLVVKDRGRWQERWEEQYPISTQTRVVSGGRGVLIRGGRKIPLAMSETTFRIPEFNPAFACKLIHARASLDVKYLGVETRNGVTVDHVQIGRLVESAKSRDDAIDSALVKMDIYVDVSTHMVSSLRRNSFSADNYDNYLPIEFLYSSYAADSGIQIPRQIQHVFNEHLIETVTITSSSVGGSVADEDFK